jgi:dienelactone hydrolase
MKINASVLLFAPALVLSGVAALAQNSAGTDTYLSFNPSDSTFDLRESMAYERPDPKVFGPGPYPVAIWVPGTGEAYVDPLSLLFVAQMASRGFFAVSVQYSNTEVFQACAQYTPRAQGIFDATRSTSAVSTICSISGAGCSKGVVTSGISQGGVLAILAKNYAPQVQAVYALSAGAFNHAEIGGNLAACMNKSVTAIPGDRLTIVNGSADPAFGSQSSTQAASGIVCATGSTQCWSSDGSGAGWYLVQNSEVTDGSADHCYIDVGGCNDNFDPKWLPPSTADWSLKPNLDWLATLGTRRQF